MRSRLVVGTFTPSVLLTVAERLGLLADAGLEVREVPVQSSPGQFTSLSDGELDVAMTSPDNVLAYRFAPDNPLGRTFDVRIVSTVDRGMGLGLYLRPGLKSAAALQGATCGVDVPTSGFALAMYEITESLGVPRAEYDLMALGSTPKRLAALLDGRCDATMLNAGNELLAERAGCVRLGRVVDVAAPYCGTVLAVAGPDLVGDARRLATALRETAGFIVAGGADDAVEDAAAERLDLPAETAHRYLGRLKDPDEGLIVDQGVDMAAVRTVLDLRRRYLPARPDGIDPMARALDPEAGLVAAGVDG